MARDRRGRGLSRRRRGARVGSLVVAMPFACGVAFYLCRAWLPLNPLLRVGLIAGTVIVRHSPLYAPAFALTLSYAVFLMAFLPGGAIARQRAGGLLLRTTSTPGRCSRRWCIASGRWAAGNIEFALPAVPSMAWLSWTFIEKLCPGVGTAFRSGERLRSSLRPRSQRLGRTGAGDPEAALPGTAAGDRGPTATRRVVTPA